MKSWLKIMCFFTVIFFFMAGFSYSAGVKNERVRQDGNRVVFEYDLDGNRETEVSVTLTIDAKKYTSNDLHLEGDYGKVSPGKNKRVYWNVLQDFPMGLHGDFKAAIEASGGDIEGMVFVKGGCYDMGDDTSGYGTEPVNNVCLDDYYMGKYEVTQKEWVAVMGSNPSYFEGCDTCPVESVSWNDVQGYIRRLISKTGQKYRLPTEAEWEYAARSEGKREKFAGFSDESQLFQYANFCDRSCESVWKTANQNDRYKYVSPVGTYRPNGLGLYDMTGNVWEWTGDWYDANYYKNCPKNNPSGPSSGQYKVRRGGSWRILGPESHSRI